MKKYINMLIPLSATLIPISIVGCSMKRVEKAIPRDYLDIEGTTLNGFKEAHDEQDELEGYNKLTIFKDITSLANAAFSYNGIADEDGSLVITKIDYEEDCLCTKYGDASFAGCANLETVIFPPLFDGTDGYLFNGCTKLKTLDLSNITVTLSDLSDLVGETVDDHTGQIIIRDETQRAAAESIQTTLTTWTIVKK